MRTLKRLMCLVLALVMVLGLGMNAFAFDLTADDFKDKADAVNTEALEVLTAIGVVVGNGNGTVTPKQTLTRQMAAVYMTKLLGVDVTGQVLPSTFPDVHNVVTWGEEYIAYCQYHDILTGYPDNTFRPDKDVTGYEFGLMLLRTLGYNVEIEKIGGDGWDIATFRCMTLPWANLTRGLDVKEYNDPITRDTAFQMMLNALVATMVHYPNGVRTRVEVAPGGTTDAYKDYRGSAPDADFYVQLCENSYPKLTLNKEDKDKFARPCTTWAYDKSPITVIPDEPNDFYRSGTFTGAKAKSYLNAISRNSKTPVIYYNGSLFAGVNFQADTAAAGSASNGLWVNETTGFAGYEISFYNTDTGWDVIVREAYLARIKSINKSTGDITLSVYEQSKANNGVSPTRYSSVTAFNFTVEAPTETTAGDDVYAALKDYAQGAYVGVYLAQNWTTYDENTPGKGDADDFILEVESLKAVPTNIKHIYDNGTKVSSWLETEEDGNYLVNNEAMWSNDALENTPTVYLPGFDNGASSSRHVKTGTATLYTIDGTVLFISQPKAAATRTDGYAYLWDTLDADPSGWKTEQGPAIHKARLIFGFNEDGTYSKAADYTEADVSYWDFVNGEEFTDIDNATGDNKPYDVDKGGILVYYQWADADSTTGAPAHYVLRLADHGTDFTTGATANTVRRRSNASLDTNKIVTNSVAQGKTLAPADPWNAQDSVFDDATRFYVVTTKTGAKGASKFETVNVYTGVRNVPTQLFGPNTEIQLVLRTDDLAMDADERTNTNVTGLIDYIVIKNPGDGSTTPDPEGTYFIVGGPYVTYHSVDVNGVQKDYYAYWAVAEDKRVTTVYVNAKINGTSPAVIARTDLEYDEDLANYSVLNISALDNTAGKEYVETAHFKTIGANVGLQDAKKGIIVIDNTTAGGQDTKTSYLIKEVPTFLYNTSTGKLTELNYTEIDENMTGYYVLETATDGTTNIAALYLTIS